LGTDYGFRGPVNFQEKQQPLILVFISNAEHAVRDKTIVSIIAADSVSNHGAAVFIQRLIGGRCRDEFSLQFRNMDVDLQEVDSKPVYKELVTDMYDCFSGYAMVRYFGINQTFLLQKFHTSFSQ